MQKNKINLVLGSASPRRKELLESIYIPFRVHASHIEEKSDFKDVASFVMDISKQKAESVYKELDTNERNLVIGSDTIVVVDDCILGKPKTNNEAKEMLMLLSGRSHFVYTGVAFWDGEKKVEFFEKTEVIFEEITSELLELYIQTGESMDKAGAYGIQRYALSFIKEVRGSYSSVVGLPVNKVLENLIQYVGAKNWRDYFAC